MGAERSRVRVVAPATTANLGPGFDCLGAALSVGLRLEAVLGDADVVSWSVTQRGAGDAERDATEIAPDLILEAVERVAGDARGIASLGMTTEIPIGRGLGSSAAAVAAGLLLGCVLAGRDADPAELLELGAPLEGHPDNLAAALFGGLVLVVPMSGRHDVLRFVPHASVRPCVVVPAAKLDTSEARRALPDVVALGDVASNVARAAGLLAALTGGAEPTRERLLACTEDALHQPYRLPLMPETGEAIGLLRDAGIAAVVSGAGPSVLCLVPEADVARFRDVSSSMEGWRPLELAWDGRGARLA